MDRPRQNYEDVLKEARRGVQEGLVLCDQEMNDIANQAPGLLGERIHKIIARKGKRVRSILLFLLASSGESGPSIERQARVAASIELLHLASLVHDDVIDASEIRRGDSTANADWGNKMAVLVGDFALSKSMELVVADEDKRLAIIISETSSKLVTGEVLELDLAGNNDVTLEQYLEVIDGKTASLIEACSLCGAILAGHDDEMVQKVGKMGSSFGMAFQIIDDLLDFGVGAGDLGKATYSDLNNGLVTLPLLMYYDSCNTEEKKSMQELTSNVISSDVQKQVFAILNESGCFQKAQKMALDHIESALATLRSLPETPGKQQLLEVCGTMAFRSN